MPSNKESAQSLKRPAPPPALPRLPVFPPLPPLPPPDTNKWIEPTRKASPLPPALTRSEPRPRRFGTKITNLLSAGDGISVVHKADHKSTSSVALAAAQKYYHQYQHSSHPGKKPCIADKLEGENYETKPEHVIKVSPIASSEDSSNKNDLHVLSKSPQSILLQEFIPKMTPMQPGHTIWSVTPDELTALAKEVAAMKKESAEPVKTLSYAEASKRNIPRFAESRASQEMKAVEDEQPERTFKKYYALPIIPSYESSRSRDIYHAATLEEKEESFQDRTGPSTEDKSAFALDQNQMSSLSATTATFYPRQTTEPNDLIQLLKASLASKKVAPHMDWWPGDWKCTNCGNHVLSPKACVLLLNDELTAPFSRYRTSRTGTHASDAELGGWKTLASYSNDLPLIHQSEFAGDDKYT